MQLIQFIYNFICFIFMYFLLLRMYHYFVNSFLFVGIFINLFTFLSGPQLPLPHLLPVPSYQLYHIYPSSWQRMGDLQQIKAEQKLKEWPTMPWPIWVSAMRERAHRWHSNIRLYFQIGTLHNCPHNVSTQKQRPIAKHQVQPWESYGKDEGMIEGSIGVKDNPRKSTESTNWDP